MIVTVRPINPHPARLVCHAATLTLHPCLPDIIYWTPSCGHRCADLQLREPNLPQSGVYERRHSRSGTVV